PDLLALEVRVDPEDLRLAGVALRVAVDADDDAVAGLDLVLELEARVGDLALREPALERLDHAAELLDPAEVVVRERLHAVRQRLDEVGAAERVGRVGDAG